MPARITLGQLKAMAAVAVVAFVAGMVVGRHGDLSLPLVAGPVRLPPKTLRPVHDQVWAGELVKVVDGDTMTVNWNSYELYLRLRNVDTAESVHPDASRNTTEGRAISAWAKDYLAGVQVRVELARFDWHLDTDRHGRALAYLWIDRGTPGSDAADELFNETLIRQGRSRYETEYGPSAAYDARFRAAEAQAKAERQGLWRR